MRWSKPITGLLVLAIVAGTVGALVTLARGALGAGDLPVPFGSQPALATVALVAVALVVAVLVGARARGGANPYW